MTEDADIQVDAFSMAIDTFKAEIAEVPVQMKCTYEVREKVHQSPRRQWRTNGRQPGWSKRRSPSCKKRS